MLLVPRPALDFDAHRIAPKLYQGSRPPQGDVLARRGFDLVVLTAAEHQPPAMLFPGVRVLHAGYHDASPADPDDVETAKDAAREVARALARGERVLVTCHMGLNRSGFVSALAMYLLAEGKLSGREAAALVRLGRPGALFNKSFSAMLAALPRRRPEARRVPGRLRR